MSDKIEHIEESLRSVIRVLQDGHKGLAESGTTAGALHRTWADLKAKLGGGDHTPY